MNPAYIEDKLFEKVDFTADPLQKGEYDHCRFVNCNFSGTDLGGITFLACEFAGCNLDLVKLVKTGFQEVKFADCKMQGLHFEHCNKFGLSVSFTNCSLNYSSFYQTLLKKTIFRKVVLREADFTESDLTG